MTLVCECGSAGAGSPTEILACPLVGDVYAATCTYTEVAAADVLAFAQNLTSEGIVYVFGWGFAAVLASFFSGYAIRQVLKLLNLA